MRDVHRSLVYVGYRRTGRSTVEPEMASGQVGPGYLPGSSEAKKKEDHMSTSKGQLKDARGVTIEAGDVVIYGFGVSRSVSMAEGVVLGADHNGQHPWPPEGGWPVSVTASGLVRVRVVRRSYSQGEKPVVAIMADRMVVLKKIIAEDVDLTCLPNSPLPTQDELLYDRLTTAVERYMDDIERLSSGGELDDHESRTGHYPNYTRDRSPERRAYWLSNYREWEARDRKQLAECCERLERPMPV